MRNFSNTLTGICLLFALIVQSEPVSAGNVYIRAGAEGVGQDAWLELNDAEQISLGLVGCKKSRGKLDLQLVCQSMVRVKCHPNWWRCGVPKSIPR